MGITFTDVMGWHEDLSLKVLPKYLCKWCIVLQVDPYNVLVTFSVVTFGEVIDCHAVLCVVYLVYFLNT